jgi:hypothetical protein
MNFMSLLFVSKLSPPLSRITFFFSGSPQAKHMDLSKWKLYEDDIAEKSSAPHPEYLTSLWPVNCSCRQLLWILSLKEHDKCLILRWRNNYAFLLFSYTSRSNNDIISHQFQAESRLDETLIGLLDCAALWALIFQTVQLYERRYTRWI